MTSLEQRRKLLGEAGAAVMKMEMSRSTADLLPALHAMIKFMGSMLEEDEANALVNLLRKNGMAR